MLDLVQLFSNDDFNKKIRVACSKISKEIIINQTAANLYFSAVDTNRRDKVYLFDKTNMDEHFQSLHQLSTCNYLVFIYENEEQLIGDERLERLADQYLPINFSQAQVYTTMKLGKKALKGHAFTHMPRKLVNTSVSEIEALLNNMESRIFWKNISGRYIGCNLLFANDFGFDTIDKIIGRKDDEILDQKSYIEFTAFDHQVVKSGKAMEGIEKEIIFPNGERNWIKMTKIPHTKEGVIIGIIGKYEIVKHENGSNGNKLNDQKLLEVLMDSIPDTIYFKDIDSKFIRVNKAQSALLEINTPDDATGKTDFDFFDEQTAKDMFIAEQQIIFDGVPQNKIEQIKLDGGKTIWMNSLKVPIKDDSGTIVGTAGISRNITELMETEHKLMAERDMLQLLIDIIPSSIYIKNAKSEFLRVNKAMVNMFGAKNMNDMLGKTDFDFYSITDAERLREEEIKVLATGKPIINKVEQSHWNIESIKWVSTTKIPFKNDKGEYAGIVGISTDITEQILIKQKLEFAKMKAEEASCAKSNFLSNMSHEIRTPMNGIVGMAELLGMTNLDQEQQKILEVISRSAQNLLSIINDILDLSRIDNGKLSLENEQINIKEIVDEVVDEIKVSARDKKNEVFLKYDYNIPELILGDQHRLKQILINLLGNSIKFTNKGEITIDVRYIGNSETHHCVKFMVIDTGIGIDTTQIDHIFDTFTQADSSTTRKYGGTGLGLAISSQLIKMMGGQLKVNSEKDKGSTFYFEIMFEKITINEHNYL